MKKVPCTCALGLNVLAVGKFAENKGPDFTVIDGALKLVCGMIAVGLLKVKLKWNTNSAITVNAAIFFIKMR